ncbi:hypothetical protein GCM10011611_35320 [Aliidongia dinghuensis]|uniref:Uncharacterized protein n=1 Tax=Aliidongia dinghuensis TaxID=1867774 RepID=A0A8J2YWT9_9PROT|nr:hypothetical protein GCM10011611_35320 [Aliidongia dinghuensis]
MMGEFDAIGAIELERRRIERAIANESGAYESGAHRSDAHRSDAARLAIRLPARPPTSRSAMDQHHGTVAVQILRARRTSGERQDEATHRVRVDRSPLAREKSADAAHSRASALERRAVAGAKRAGMERI